MQKQEERDILRLRKTIWQHHHTHIAVKYGFFWLIVL